MSTPTGNGYVKWSWLITILTPLVMGMLAFTYHTGHQNIARTEFGQFEKRFDTHTQSIMELKDILLDLKNEIQQLQK